MPINFIDLEQKFNELKTKFDLPTKKNKLKQLEIQVNNPNLWQDTDRARKILKEQARLIKQVNDFEIMELMAIEKDIKGLDKLLAEYETLLLFSGDYDERDAIFAIHAGQGGTEAMDWTSMLLRMYTRYFEIMDWKTQMIDKIPGEDAGIKSVTFNVLGDYVYGHLKAEAGTHRLVRQSPFNANNLRQTSFAMVEVFPIVEDAEVNIKEEDLEWQFYRSGGHGGQNVNKVSTAVRLTHKPSQIIVTCQEERYQQKNRDLALKVLRGKLWQIEEEEKVAKQATFKKGTMASWGTQIRSYVLHPYKLVKDLRTNYESTNPEEVLDGNLTDFIKAYLLKFS